MDVNESLTEAWKRVERAITTTPYANWVRISPALPPVLGYRVGIPMSYRPVGKTRLRNEEVWAEKPTLVAALNALADAMEARPK